jgi:hypothetical protein
MNPLCPGFPYAEAADRLPQLVFNTKMFSDAAKRALTVSGSTRSGAVGQESEDEDEEDEVVDHDAVDEDEDEAFAAPASAHASKSAGQTVDDGFAVPFVVTGVALNGFARYAGMAHGVCCACCARLRVCLGGSAVYLVQV